MYAGIAAGLMVFAGLWRATEFMMDGRSEGAARLVPVGIAYLVLGCLIVATVGNSIVLWLSLLAVMTGLLGAYLSRGKASIRAWVIWAFILLDGAIIASIAMALIA